MDTIIMQSAGVQGEDLVLLRADMRMVMNMPITYRMYRIDQPDLDGYAIEASGADEQSPLFLFDRSEPRANAFYLYLVEAEVFPCTLGDILEDVCGRFCGLPAQKNRDFSLQIPENMVR